MAIALAARAGRRVLLPAAVGGAAVTLAMLVANLGALGELWQGIVTDHTGAKGITTVGDNADRLLHLLEWRTPFAWLVWAGAVAFVVSRHARRAWPLATLVPAAAAFILYLRPSVTTTSRSCRRPTPSRRGRQSCSRGLRAEGSARGRVRPVSARRRRVRPGGSTLRPQRPARASELVWAARVIEQATDPGDVVATDQPLVNFLAGRRLPGYLSDTSNTRFESGALTGHEVLAEIVEASGGSTGGSHVPAAG